MLEPQNKVKNKNAEAHFIYPCSYKEKSVYLREKKRGRNEAISKSNNDFPTD